MPYTGFVNCSFSFPSGPELASNPVVEQNYIHGSFLLGSILQLGVLERRAVVDKPSDAGVASAAAELEADGVLQLLSKGLLRPHVGCLHSSRGFVQGKGDPRG